MKPAISGLSKSLEHRPVAGGSSGGSAAAIAADLCAMATGTVTLGPRFDNPPRFAGSPTKTQLRADFSLGHDCLRL